MNIRSLLDRLRDSLFAIPASFIVAGALLALVTARIDRSTSAESAPEFLAATIEGARTILGTLAGATITVAAVVFSIMAVTVQLSSSQYSPRVLQGFLRDRYQQVIVGIVVGTFTFSLVALGALGRSSRDGTDAASWSVITATVLGIATALAIVAFVDHINRRVRVDDTIRRLAGETTASMERAADALTASSYDEDFSIAADTDRWQLYSDRSGWVVGIDAAYLAGRLPDGTIARIEPPIGAYINVGDPLVTLWTAASPGPAAEPEVETAGCIAVSTTRTIAQVPGFGMRQLVDIALRALSPGINDPTTAADVTRQLVGPVRVALAAPHRSIVHHGPRGVRVYRPAMQSAADLLTLAFREIRLCAARHPGVYAALSGSLQSLRSSTLRHGHSGHLAAIDAQIALVDEAAREAGFEPSDLLAGEGWTAPELP